MVELNHLIKFLNLLGEVIQPFIGMLIGFDADKDGDADIEFIRIQQRNPIGDDT